MGHCPCGIRGKYVRCLPESGNADFLFLSAVNRSYLPTRRCQQWRKRPVTPQVTNPSITSLLWGPGEKQFPYFLCQQREALGDASKDLPRWWGSGRGYTLKHLLAIEESCRLQATVPTFRGSGARNNQIFTRGEKPSLCWNLCRQSLHISKHFFRWSPQIWLQDTLFYVTDTFPKVKNKSSFDQLKEWILS